MPGKNIYAVITGDIVDSSKGGKEHHALMLATLRESFKKIELLIPRESKSFPFDIFRGDSFQGIISSPEQALAATLVIRSSLCKARPEGARGDWDARTAVGIGMVDSLPEQVTEGDGEAFRRSGPYLDRMKPGQRLSIITPWNDLNREMGVQAALLDAIIAKWSPQQAEIVLELLEGKSRKKIAESYDISQAAVHYRVKGSGWDAIKKLLKRFETVVKDRISKE